LNGQTPERPNCLTDDLFLLDCEWQSLQTWVFGFEDGCVEAVVVLSDAMLAGSYAVEFDEALTYEVDDHSILLSRRDFTRFHLFRMTVL
jgi:hypothetical protein